MMEHEPNLLECIESTHLHVKHKEIMNLITAGISKGGITIWTAT